MYTIVYNCIQLSLSFGNFLKIQFSSGRKQFVEAPHANLAWSVIVNHGDGICRISSSPSATYHMFSLTKSIPKLSLYFSFHNFCLFSLVLEFSHSYNSLISLFCCFFHCSLPPYPNLNSAQQLLPFLQAITAKSHLPKTKKKVQQPRSRLPTRMCYPLFWLRKWTQNASCVIQVGRTRHWTAALRSAEVSLAGHGRELWVKARECGQRCRRTRQTDAAASSFFSSHLDWTRYFLFCKWYGLSVSGNLTPDSVG